MIDSPDFLSSVLNSVSEHIVVIDSGGTIKFVNQAWKSFGISNKCKISPDEWQTVNYLGVCDKSASRGEEFGRSAAVGIRKVIDREADVFNIEYPCHSNGEKRWFLMSVTPLEMAGAPHFAISHMNITKRKLAEDHLRDLSRMDGLTNVPNRRYFDEFLTDEWKRCCRTNLPVSVAIMDIDHFKQLNDHYGHPAGDECLIKIGGLLNSVRKRPSDMFARYGGEEFAFAFGNATSEQALVPVSKIINSICNLEIPNIMSPTKPIVTVSVGLATMSPEAANDKSELLKLADTRLYSAKNTGRNRIVSS